VKQWYAGIGRGPAGASPAQVGSSACLIVSVAWWKSTTVAKPNRNHVRCGIEKLPGSKLGVGGLLIAKEVPQKRSVAEMV
jgi:hypothetical protein